MVLGNRVVRNVKDDKTLQRLQRSAQGIKTDICLMTDEHALGVDLRFGAPAQTVIVVPRDEELPTRYMYLQMAGRCQRDIDFPTVTIFSAGGVSSGGAIVNRMT